MLKKALVGIILGVSILGFVGCGNTTTSKDNAEETEMIKSSFEKDFSKKVDSVKKSMEYYDSFKGVFSESGYTEASKMFIDSSIEYRQSAIFTTDKNYTEEEKIKCEKWNETQDKFIKALIDIKVAYSVGVKNEIKEADENYNKLLKEYAIPNQN